jgi:hypothetical protein
MSELWGWQSGQSQAQQDNQSKQLFQLSMAEGAVKLETEKFTLENAKLSLQRQEQALRLFQMGSQDKSAGNNPVQETSDVLMRLGNAEMQAGLLEEGGKKVYEAAKLQEGHQKIVNETTTNQIKRFTFAANLLDGVHNEASWEQMKMVYQSEFGEPLDPNIANRPYDPQLIDMLRKGAVTQLQQANIAKSQAQIDSAKAAQAANYARVPYYQAAARAADARADALGKNGNTNIRAKPADLSSVTSLIMNDFPDTDRSKARILAEPIAEEMTRMIKDGMDPVAARNKAYGDAKAAGQLWGLRTGKARPGETAANPLPIPQAGGKPDVAAMIDNQYYEVPGHPGWVAVFDKKRGGLSAPVKQVPDEPAGTSAASEDDEEDDE